MFYKAPKTNKLINKTAERGLLISKPIPLIKANPMLSNMNIALLS